MTMRVVSVGDKRAYERMWRVLSEACAEEGVPPEQSKRIVSRAAEVLHREGFALTWQVAPR